MGLDTVVKSISEKTEAECRDISARAAAEAAKVKGAAEAEAKQATASALAGADQSVSKLRQRELASAKLDVKKSRLNAEKDVLADVRTGFTRRLAALPREKKVDMYQKLIKLAKREVPTGKIYTSAADADLVKGQGYEFGGTRDCLGGILVTSGDGSVNLDYTFDSILEEVWSASMKPISDILFAGG